LLALVPRHLHQYPPNDSNFMVLPAGVP
jgi:hypothetical protein